MYLSILCILIFFSLNNSKFKDTLSLYTRICYIALKKIGVPQTTAHHRAGTYYNRKHIGIS